MSGRIFVFGSNLAGIHGAGSARHAYQHHGAVWGVGSGPMGYSYAIPTKAENVRDVLSLGLIHVYIDLFLQEAERNRDTPYDVVAIGCGLAGYKPEQIAPMFMHAPKNCYFVPAFEKIIGTWHDRFGDDCYGIAKQIEHDTPDAGRAG